MKETRFKRRDKAVVSLYVDLKLWHRFGVVCEERETTRGKQIVKFLEAKLAAWEQEQQGKRREAHG